MLYAVIAGVELYSAFLIALKAKGRRANNVLIIYLPVTEMICSGRICSESKLQERKILTSVLSIHCTQTLYGLCVTVPHGLCGAVFLC